ncbi:MAG: hypothetical protein FRX49_03815 [Trebouxia sp. A1-2]|nr:MAG: hypothetical protein FRX49_03815 [Trebouxia sp. A1-2]
MEMQASNENESYNKARGLPIPTKSPAVRLHINIDDKPAAQEVIRKVTQAHEIVEVDGFVFKRKRSVSHGIPSQMQQLQSAEKRARLPNTNDLASSPSPAFQATPSPNSTAAGEVAAAEAAAQESVEQAADKTPTAQHTSEATTALLEQLPADMSQPDRLASLCQLLCAAELKDLSAGSPSVPLDPAVAKVVENVLETFVHTVQSAAADGTLQAEPQTEPKAAKTDPAAENDVMFKVDLEARKAGLRAQLAAFIKEEEEWQEVLAQQDTWQHAAEPFSPRASAQPGNRPADAALATGEAAAAFVSAGSAQGGAPAPEADDHAVQADLADALVPAGADQSAAALVEGLCSMVSGVEELVAKAEKHCTAMQARYHQERFRTHPHIDSPAKLIQELLKPAGIMTRLSQ